MSQQFSWKNEGIRIAGWAVRAIEPLAVSIGKTREERYLAITELNLAGEFNQMH
jgi:hypothetical protein